VRRGWWLLGVALVVMVLVRGFLVQSFFVPSSSMEPTLHPGDRIVVATVAPASGLHRGDLVVFDGTSVFARKAVDPAASGTLRRALASLQAALSLPTDESDYVKRVIGLPGDRVRCCEESGRVQVNGRSVDEPYVMPGDTPSDVRFDVTVPNGRVWVLGDHRSRSADSRSHLGDPGGGMVPVSDLIGRPILVYWPLQHARSLARQPTLAGLPRGGDE
jgi:signal peptidase I